TSDSKTVRLALRRSASPPRAFTSSNHITDLQTPLAHPRPSSTLAWHRAQWYVQREDGPLGFTPLGFPAARFHVPEPGPLPPETARACLAFYLSCATPVLTSRQCRLLSRFPSDCPLPLHC
ncbi:hypothetical protein AURDEDRAFT_160803, partial [Auricularia subglabra TFB-10046 SS5]